MKDAIDHCEMMKADHRDAWFSLEPCYGETYARGDEVALYGHYKYDRSSVLAGQESRCFIDSWPVEDADRVVDELTAAGIKVDRWGGSSHVPVSQVVQFLPDDDDWGGGF